MGHRERVTDDATCQLWGGTLGVWGTGTAQVLGREQPSIPSTPGDAGRPFSCPVCAFPKDTGAARVKLAQVLRFLLPHTSKAGTQRQQESSR